MEIPKSLRAKLKVPETFQTLADLSARSWSTIGRRGCYELGLLVETAVVELLKSPNAADIRGVSLPTLSPAVGKFLLPVVSARVANALQRAFGANLSEGSRAKTIADVLNLQGFGVKSLVELLTALESIPGAVQSAEREAERSAELSRRHSARTRKLLEEIARLPDSNKIFRCDPRFGESVGKISSAGVSLAEAATCAFREGAVRTSADLIHCLKTLIADIHGAKRIFLEAELRIIIRRTVSQRDGDIVMRHCGFDGLGGSTLEVIGLSLGLTRERVRQIVKRTVQKVPSASYVPVLDRALRAISRNMPQSSVALSVALQDAKISADPFDVRGIEKACKQFAKTCVFVFHSTYPDLVCDQKDQDAVSAIVAETSSISSSNGAGNLVQLRLRLEHGEKTFNDQQMKNIIGIAPDIVWLDEDKVWFCHRSGKNRLRNCTRKMLSVSPTLDVAEIRAGLARNHRMEVTPPKRVALAVCKIFPEFAVSGTSVSMASANGENYLSGLERNFFRILSSHDGVCSRDQLERECVAAGMNRNSFYQYLSYSPILERVGNGVYALRGAQIPPGLVDELRKRSERKGTVLIDYGWRDGEIWVAYRLSTSMIRNGVYSIPSALSAFLFGGFDFVDESSGTRWMVDNGATYGSSLSTLFSITGAVQGDYLVLVFDVAKHTGKAYTGTHELALSFSERLS